MKLNYQVEYTEPNAKREACDILEEEANELAGFVESKLSHELTHRVRIAIHREIVRLRAISQSLKP